MQACNKPANLHAQGSLERSEVHAWLEAPDKGSSPGLGAHRTKEGTHRLHPGAGLAKDHREDMAAIPGLCEVAEGLAHARPQRGARVPVRAKSGTPLSEHYSIPLHSNAACTDGKTIKGVRHNLSMLA